MRLASPLPPEAADVLDVLERITPTRGGMTCEQLRAYVRGHPSTVPKALEQLKARALVRWRNRSGGTRYLPTEET